MVHEAEKKTLIIRTVDAGTCLGSLGLLSKAPRVFSLKALTDTTCLILSREKFTKAIENFSDLVPKILKAVVESVHIWEERFLADSDESCEKWLQKIGVSLV